MWVHDGRRGRRKYRESSSIKGNYHDLNRPENEDGGGTCPMNTRLSMRYRQMLDHILIERSNWYSSYLHK